MAKTKIEKTTEDTISTNQPNPSITYDVERHSARVRGRGGDWEDVHNGWMIVRTTPDGRRQYCGEGFNWCQLPLINVPFKDEDTARMHAKFHAKQQEDAAKLLEVKTTLVEIPYCDVAENGCSSFAVYLQLTPQQARLLLGVRVALQQMKAEVANGQRVDSNPATIRWIIDQLSESV
jgi:hypothetical protein